MENLYRVSSSPSKQADFLITLSTLQIGLLIGFILVSVAGGLHAKHNNQQQQQPAVTASVPAAVPSSSSSTATQEQPPRTILYSSQASVASEGSLRHE
jgi:hypothetical protein